MEFSMTDIIQRFNFGPIQTILSKAVSNNPQFSITNQTEVGITRNCK